VEAVQQEFSLPQLQQATQKLQAVQAYATKFSTHPAPYRFKRRPGTLNSVPSYIGVS